MNRRPPVSRGWIALLGLSSGISAFGMASLVPALPQLAQALGVGFGQIQWVVSAYLLGLGLAQPVQGALADRFGRRPVMLAGFAVFALASVVGMLASSLALLVAVRFLQALGGSVATVVTRAMVRDTHDAESAAITLAFITAMMGLAPIVAPLAGGLVSEWFGWRGILGLHSAMSLALLLLLALKVRETRPPDTLVLSPAALARGFLSLVRDRGFMGHTMIYGFSTGATFAFLTVGAALCGKLFGMSSATFGVFWASLGFAYMGGAAMAGPLARRFGQRRVLEHDCIGITVACVAFAALGALLPPSIPEMAACLALLMGSIGVAQPLALAGAVGERPEIAGLAAGVSSALGLLTGMVFSAATGFVYDGTQLTTGFLLLACGALTWAASRVASKSHANRRTRRESGGEVA